MSVINLTPAEVQSGYDRVAWAEGLIQQLPKTHEGRNSWLLNYGRSEEAKKLQGKRTDCVWFEFYRALREVA